MTDLAETTPAAHISRPSDCLTYTVEEAGRRLGISRGLAYQLAHSGDLPTVRLGKRLLVPRHALEKLIGMNVPPQG